jgi:DNA-binding MarR family transcriptional regulator
LPNPEDKRAKLAELTVAGRKLLRQLEKQQQAWVEAIATDCSNADINGAFQSVKKIRQRMEQ